MDDFDQEVNQDQETVNANENNQEQVAITSSTDSTESNSHELKIEDLIEPGRYGVSNSQMIPALKKAIGEQSIEKVALIKATYSYIFYKSVRYLKKAEREFIEENNI